MGALRLADHECPYSIWLEQDGGGWWSWELIDKDGETSMTGQALGRAAALDAARDAAGQGVGDSGAPL